MDVWRSVPTVNDVALTGPDNGILRPRGPNETGGYQLDARVATLQEQALGAFTNHAQLQNAPPQQLLDDLSSFQRVLFTNHRVRALSDAVREGMLLPDLDPGSLQHQRRTSSMSKRVSPSTNTSLQLKPLGQTLEKGGSPAGSR